MKKLFNNLYILILSFSIILGIAFSCNIALSFNAKQSNNAFAQSDEIQTTVSVPVTAVTYEDNKGYEDGVIENRNVAFNKNYLNLRINTNSDAVAIEDMGNNNFVIDISKGNENSSIASISIDANYNFNSTTNIIDHWDLSSDTAQNILGFDNMGEVGTGAFIVETSYDGKNYNQTSSALKTVNVTEAFSPSLYNTSNNKYKQVYIPSGKDINKGVYIRIRFAYEVFRTTYSYYDFSEGKVLYQTLLDNIKLDGELLKWVCINVFRMRYSKLWDSKTLWQYLQGKDEPGVKPNKDKLFVCSMSLDEDSLQLWRYYSKNDRMLGYRIAFDSGELLNSIANWAKSKKVKYTWVKVCYDLQNSPEGLMRYISDNYKEWRSEKDGKRKVEICNQVWEALWNYRLFFKDKSFSGENEIRIILLIKDEQFNKLLRKKDFEVEIKLRQVNEYFIPYIDVPIIPDALSECDCTLINDIKISPTVNDIQAKNSLQLLLQKYPWANCTVSTSPIPLRYI